MVAQDASRQAMGHGLKEVEVLVRGPGAGRESAVRALQAIGLDLTATDNHAVSPTDPVTVLGGASGDTLKGSAGVDVLTGNGIEQERILTAVGKRRIPVVGKTAVHDSRQELGCRIVVGDELVPLHLGKFAGICARPVERTRLAVIELGQIKIIGWLAGAIREVPHRGVVGQSGVLSVMLGDPHLRWRVRQWLLDPENTDCRGAGELRRDTGHRQRCRPDLPRLRRLKPKCSVVARAQHNRRIAVNDSGRRVQRLIRHALQGLR